MAIPAVATITRNNSCAVTAESVHAGAEISAAVRLGTDFRLHADVTVKWPGMSLLMQFSLNSTESGVVWQPVASGNVSLDLAAKVAIRDTCETAMMSLLSSVRLK